jgi:hypothetical protein
MTEFEKWTWNAVMEITRAVKDITCMIPTNESEFITERLKRIHENMSRLEDPIRFGKIGNAE